MTEKRERYHHWLRLRIWRAVYLNGLAAKCESTVVTLRSQLALSKVTVLWPGACGAEEAGSLLSWATNCLARTTSSDVSCSSRQGQTWMFCTCGFWLWIMRTRWHLQSRFNYPPHSRQSGLHFTRYKAGCFSWCLPPEVAKPILLLRKFICFVLSRTGFLTSARETPAPQLIISTIP